MYPRKLRINNFNSLWIHSIFWVSQIQLSKLNHLICSCQITSLEQKIWLLHNSLCVLVVTREHTHTGLLEITCKHWSLSTTCDGRWLNRFSGNNSEAGGGAESPCGCRYKPLRSRWWWPHVHLHALGGHDWDHQWEPRGTPCLTITVKESRFSTWHINMQFMTLVKTAFVCCVLTGRWTQVTWSSYNPRVHFNWV